MIASGAFGALTVGNVKWVWWFFGMCWFLHIIFALGKSWAEVPVCVCLCVCARAHT